MPEMPEIKNYVRNLNSLFSGKTVVDFRVYNNKTYEGLGDVREAKFLGATSHGKESFFWFDKMNLKVHLMLNGGFNYNDKSTFESLKNKMISFKFDNDTYLTITDYSGYAKISCYANPNLSVMEPLSDSFTFKYFLNQVELSPKMNIKALLINQDKIVGIGNAYSDEILYEAMISPKSIAGKIPNDKLMLLFDCINKVLKNAIEEIQKKSPTVLNGEDRDFLKVHIKGLDFTANNEKIIVEKIASKKTYYVDNQVIYN